MEGTGSAFVNVQVHLDSQRKSGRCICSASESASGSRRIIVIGVLGGMVTLLFPQRSVGKPINPEYPDKETKFIPKGYPTDGPLTPPKFDSSKEVEKAEDLEYQDVEPGKGRQIELGNLAVAHWKTTLENGLIVGDTRIEGKPMLFRVGAGQVEKAVDRMVEGMRVGGRRRIKGLSAAMLSDITTGERSLIPSDSQLYIDLELLGINPYGG
ncbi:hypothetical protein NDN08_006459 [Rhodosorus marinus]|uniref:peptidylprolyl isomerase n=1 Tax=Rhodosorus marinus TaxID=101924 RepID=A0AAV8UN16_9RHOD|nr:hypothetical protein NDN08_006459 [Rhodosorus marinus]